MRRKWAFNQVSGFFMVLYLFCVCPFFNGTAIVSFFSAYLESVRKPKAILITNHFSCCSCNWECKFSHVNSIMEIAVGQFNRKGGFRRDIEQKSERHSSKCIQVVLLPIQSISVTSTTISNSCYLGKCHCREHKEPHIEHAYYDGYHATSTFRIALCIDAFYLSFIVKKREGESEGSQENRQQQMRDATCSRLLCEQYHAK